MTLIQNSIYLIILLALTAGGVSAQESSEQDELDEFLNLLEQQTSLATTTRLNADFVPGMLSVLDYEQMQRRGFRILWEALGSLPGVQTTMSSTGMRSVTVRGVGGIFEPSKVKLLLNPPDILHCWLDAANVAGFVAGRMAGVAGVVPGVTSSTTARANLLLSLIVFSSCV